MQKKNVTIVLEVPAGRRKRLGHSSTQGNRNLEGFRRQSLRERVSMIPEIFLDRMKEMLAEEYQDFEASLEQERYQALRLNGCKKNSEGKTAAEVLASQQEQRVVWAENGYYYAKDRQPGKSVLHEAGLYYIQEPSAMAPVTLLEVQPGEKVLDLCAAPGGKSTQLAAALQGEGLLVCNEIHPARAAILSENIERMGVSNACVTNEAPAHLAEIFVEYFDKILVDAPCSGEGMFRKNEAACEEWSPENVALCAARQDEILDCAVKMLRPGGRLVYSTCTFAPQENEGSISRLLLRHPEFRILPADKVKKAIAGGNTAGCDGVREWGDYDVPAMQDTLRLWPHKIKGEGHFAALLQKGEEAQNGYRTLSAGGLEKGILDKTLQKEWAEYLNFAQDNLQVAFAGKYLQFGDNLYLAPNDMPALKGIRVLRPGLHLGTLKKKRFEPSHALALALSPAQARHTFHLPADGPAAKAYLNGQTFAAEGEKGWYLICVDGFSIGWGKLAGGIMKNHYPKGLRKNWN